MLPDFIGIGAARAGSRWTYMCLREHPSVSLARNAKGSRFFERYYDRGLGWYEKFFEGCEPGRVRGEIDETYISCPEAPERIARDLPRVRLFCCLRNPIERAFSAYLYFRRMGFIREPLETALVNYRKILIDDALYHDQLTGYLKHVPRERLLVLLFDDLQKDPAGFIRSVYGFIGVDPAFQPTILHEKVNEGGAPRSWLLNRCGILLARFLRDVDMLGPYYRLRNSRLVQTLMFAKAYGRERPEFPEAARQRLREAFKGQIEGLSGLLNRDLSLWN